MSSTLPTVTEGESVKATLSTVDIIGIVAGVIILALLLFLMTA
jgi:hypothetical protein